MPSDSVFIVNVPPEQVTREKQKARDLRKTQWWQRKISGGVCHYCGRKFAPGDLTMDHIVPVIRGGHSTKGNLVPACRECNNRKKYLLPMEWADYVNGFAANPGTGDGTAQRNEDNENGQM